jgi:hypothetical protein
MAVLVIQHAVADFAAWKKAFDSDPMGRARNGVTRYTILRPADDPNYAVVSLEFSSVESAQRFRTALGELWGRVGDQIGFGGAAGVQARVLEEVERVEY